MHNQRMLVGERCFTFDKLNSVSFQLVEDDLRFVGLDLSASLHQFLHRQILVMASPIGLPMIESGKVENRFAQRFAGDGSMMNANAANAASAIDNSDSLAKLGALDCGFLPRRTGADNCHIVLSIHRAIASHTETESILTVLCRADQFPAHEKQIGLL